MRILLDVCTPVQVRKALTVHEVRTAAKMGWGDLENGDLLLTAEKAGFEVIVICDKNLRYQQNLAERKIAIVELWTNHRPTLEQHLPLITSAVDGIQPGSYVTVAPLEG